MRFTHIYENARNPWYTEESQAKQQTKQFRDNMAKIAEAKKLHAFNKGVVVSFQRNFYNLNNREALEEEVIENLQDQIEPLVVKDIILELAKERMSSTDSDFLTLQARGLLCLLEMMITCKRFIRFYLITYSSLIVITVYNC